MIMRPVVPALATAPTKNQLLGQFLAASSERRVIQGMRNSLAAMRHIGGGSGVAEPRTERNIPILVVMAFSLLLILPMLLVFYWFLAATAPPLPAGLFWSVVLLAVLYD